jgi:hypothetical protein
MFGPTVWWKESSEPVAVSGNAQAPALAWSEHRVRVRSRARNPLQHILMLDDLSLVVQPEDVNSRPVAVIRAQCWKQWRTTKSSPSSTRRNSTRLPGYSPRNR